MPTLVCPIAKHRGNGGLLTKPVQWYSRECSNRKKNLKRALKLMKKQPYDRNPREKYIAERKKYRSACKKAEAQFRRKVLNKLLSIEIENPKMFWNTLKQMQGWGREKRDPSTLIPPDKWATHFKQLLNSKLTQDLPTIESMGSTIFDPHCDRRITLKELSDVLQRAKNGKASGPDGVLLEYIKYATPECS